jgi:hypothetical protein
MFIDTRSGAIGAVVIDDKDISVWYFDNNPPQKLVDVVTLVVCRCHHRHSHAPMLCATSR